MATRQNYVKGQIIWCSYLKEMKEHLKESEFIKRARRKAKGQEPVHEAKANIVEMIHKDRPRRPQASIKTQEEQEERELVHQ